MVGYSLGKGVNPEGSKFRIFAWLVWRGSVTKRAEGFGREYLSGIHILHLGTADLTLYPPAQPAPGSPAQRTAWTKQTQTHAPWVTAPSSSVGTTRTMIPNVPGVQESKHPTAKLQRQSCQRILAQKVGPLSSITFTRRYSTWRSEECPYKMCLHVTGFKKFTN